jgi:hypothetical protein
MIRKTGFLLILIAITAIVFFNGNRKVANAQNFPDRSGIPARLAADYIHSVIEAGRKVYSYHIVDRLGKKINLKATEDWETKNTLLLPAQFLLTSSQMSNQRGVGMRYSLMGLWPINPENGPASAKEKLGLEQVVKNPKEPFTWVVQTHGIWYFQAIYPDIAVNDSCVSCHNSHMKSPKHNFHKGDVMGGIMINFPLGRFPHKESNEQFLIAPEVVADYVHSVLESDRTVYAKYIVNRLTDKNVLAVKENWMKEDALMLPAQFMLKASAAREKSLRGLDFRLISLWPINDKNGPANAFEREGLESIVIHPIRPYIGQTSVGRKKFFQAIYPDIAVTPACVTCHNSHPRSSKKDFKLDDVMGGIVVTLPLN